MGRLGGSVLGLLAIFGAGCSPSSSAAPAPPDPVAGADGGPAPASTVPATPPNPGESGESKELPKDPTSELVFGIASDIVYPVQGAQLFADVRVGGVLAASETIDAKTGPLFPHEVRIVAPAGMAASEVAFRVQLLRDTGDVSIQRLVKTTFTSGAIKVVRVMLESQCTGMPCGVSTTCIGGACVSNEVSGLPDYTSDWATHPCGSGTTPEVVLGQSVGMMFAPLTDGDGVPLNYGPQGGAHLFMALQIRNLPRDVIATLSADGLPATGYAGPFFPNADGSCELTSLLFRVDTSSMPPSALPGKELQLTGNVTDGHGHSASTMRRIVIR